MPGFDAIKIKTTRREGNQVTMTIGGETLGGSIHGLGEFIRRLRHMHRKTMGAAPPASFSEHRLFTEAERRGLREATAKAWKRQSITIPLYGGGEREMKASVLGVWAVHKGANGWAVTHVPSGALLASMISTMKKAKAGVEEMVKTTPSLLTMKQSETHARYDELRKWKGRIEA